MLDYPGSVINEANRHDIAEILFRNKGALTTNSKRTK
jgi:hypothetical protein